MRSANGEKRRGGRGREGDEVRQEEGDKRGKK